MCRYSGQVLFNPAKAAQVTPKEPPNVTFSAEKTACHWKSITSHTRQKQWASSHQLSTGSVILELDLLGYPVIVLNRGCREALSQCSFFFFFFFFNNLERFEDSGAILAEC